MLNISLFKKLIIFPKLILVVLLVTGFIFSSFFHVKAEDDRQYKVIGETGSLEINQPEENRWYTIYLEKSYDNPVVIMKPISFNGTHPAHVRLRNVRSNSFQYKIEEWDYIESKIHTQEKVGYIVLENGNHVLRDGRQIEAGNFDIQNTKIRSQVIDDKINLKNWKKVFFNNNWLQKPIILSQVQTNHDTSSVHTRIADVTPKFFYSILEKQESWSEKHGAQEKVGFVAVERGKGAGLTGLKVTHEWYELELNQSLPPSYVFLADIQTTKGPDSIFLRYKLNNNRIPLIYLQEETSLDEDIMHTEENIGYLIFQNPGILYGITLSESQEQNENNCENETPGVQDSKEIEGNIELRPIADGGVYQYSYLNWNMANRGKFESMKAGWHPTAGESRFYIKFDLQDKPPVEKAILKLFHVQTEGEIHDTLGVHRVVTPWYEGDDTYHPGQVEEIAEPGELSWIQQPLVIGQPVVTFKPKKLANEWVEIDITYLVKQWQVGVDNYGLMVKTTNQKPNENYPESAYMFSTRENSNHEQQPRLVLEF